MVVKRECEICNHREGGDIRINVLQRERERERERERSFKEVGIH